MLSRCCQRDPASSCHTSLSVPRRHSTFPRLLTRETSYVAGVASTSGRDTDSDEFRLMASPTATMPKFRPSFCSLALRPLESQYVSVPLLVMVTLTPLSARAALNWSQLLAVLHALATAFLMDSL